LGENDLRGCVVSYSFHFCCFDYLCFLQWKFSLGWKIRDIAEALRINEKTINRWCSIHMNGGRGYTSNPEAHTIANAGDKTRSNGTYKTTDLAQHM